MGTPRTAHLRSLVDAFGQLAQATHQLRDGADSRQLLQGQMYTRGLCS